MVSVLRGSTSSPNLWANFFSISISGHVRVAEDDEVDEQVDAEHDDEPLEDADSVGEDAAEERQQQRVAAVRGHMREPGDHLPPGEDHENGEREIRQVLQQMRIEQEDEQDETGEQVRDLR